MARSRIIKPEFWTSEDILELTFEERLFYIGFWNFADDSGILPDKPRTLKCMIFPADNVDCKKITDNLVTCGVLVRYMVGTKSYLKVAQWDTHQSVRHPTYKYPLPNGEIPVHVRYKSGTCTEGVPQERRGEKGREEKRRGVGEKRKPPKKTKPFKPPTLSDVDGYCKEKGLSVEPRAFFDFFETGDWHDSNGKPVRNWKQKLLTWEAKGNGRAAGSGKSNSRIQSGVRSKPGKYAHLGRRAKEEALSGVRGVGVSVEEVRTDSEQPDEHGTGVPWSATEGSTGEAD